MLIEPAGTINTGDADGDLTAEDDKGSSLLLTLASFLHKQKLGISKGLKPEGSDIRIALPKKLQVIYLISGS
jgi:hypothetical protein